MSYFHIQAIVTFKVTGGAKNRLYGGGMEKAFSWAVGT